jgi:hypothetical protein
MGFNMITMIKNFWQSDSWFAILCQVLLPFILFIIVALLLFPPIIWLLFKIFNYLSDQYLAYLSLFN